MLVVLGWLLVAGSPAPVPFHPAPVVHRTAGRVTLWTDHDDPYRRGQEAGVFLSVDEPSYVAVFRVDTDGRIRVLFPRQPWTDTYVSEQREVEVTGIRGGRAFRVDDDPGIGYLFAVAATEPLDFRAITRGDYWDYRLIGGGWIQGDPYVRLTDLAARLAPDGDYDYDVVPYYVDHRYDYPRFVCYDCHAYAGYSEWDPYGAACSRYRVVVRDDPRYYPYRYGGRNVVAQRPAHPGPRYVMRDADPGRPWVSRGEPERRREDDAGDLGRTGEDVGGRGSVPVPTVQSLRRRDHEVTPELSPARRVLEDRRRAAPRPDERPDEPADSGGDRFSPADRPDDEDAQPDAEPNRRPPATASQKSQPLPTSGAAPTPADPGRPTRNEPAPPPDTRQRATERTGDDGRAGGREMPDGLRPTTAQPRSTGEPELKRRRP